MKTKRFNAIVYNHTFDKLVCDGQPVTELTKVGPHWVGIVNGQMRSWGADGGTTLTYGKPLEVVIPEPEKPREFTRDDARSMMRKHRKNQDGSWAALDEAWVDSIMDGYLLGISHGREALDPEEAKANSPAEEMACWGCGHIPGIDHDPDCKAKAVREKERIAGVECRPSTQSQGWVPLHNGVPQWAVASCSRAVAQHGYDGPVEPCIVKPKPMTREAARALTKRHLDAKYKGDYQPEDWAIDACLESHNGRAEGV